MRSPLYASLLSLSLLVGQAPSAAAAVRVSLLTMDRGPELYARFGHSALHVHGDGQDVVYNYGYTRFGDEGLVWGFLRGEVRFWVEVSTLAQTIALYELEGRSLQRYPLALSDAEHARLAEALRVGRRPENRYYTYHHFDDNCATRLRDAIDRATGGALRRAWVGRPAGLTLRDAVREGFAGRVDVLLLSELVLGRAVDRPIDAWQAAFLPQHLAQQLRALERGGRPLAGPPEQLLIVYNAERIDGDPRTAARLLWLAAALAALAGVLATRAMVRRRRWPGVWLAAHALFVALGGALVYGLALFSVLPELRRNELLLWLWPTDLLLVGLALRLLRGRFYAGRLLRGYCLTRALVAVLLAAAQLLGVLFQQPRAWAALVGLPAILLWLAVRRLPPAREPPPAAPPVAADSA